MTPPNDTEAAEDNHKAVEIPYRGQMRLLVGGDFEKFYFALSYALEWSTMVFRAKRVQNIRCPELVVVRRKVND